MDKSERQLLHELFLQNAALTVAVRRLVHVTGVGDALESSPDAEKWAEALGVESDLERVKEYLGLLRMPPRAPERGIAPRNLKSQVDHVTALAESLLCAVAALSTQTDQNETVKQFRDCSAVLLALSQGKDHSDEYLTFLEQEIERVRKFLQG